MPENSKDNKEEIPKKKFYKESPKNKGINYIDGVSKSVAKKIAIYEFGEGQFVSITKDTVNWNFLIVINDTVEDWQVKRFTAYWGFIVKKLSQD